jgi:hypothetical protein
MNPAVTDRRAPDRSARVFGSCWHCASKGDIEHTLIIDRDGEQRQRPICGSCRRRSYRWLGWKPASRARPVRRAA